MSYLKVVRLSKQSVVYGYGKSGKALLPVGSIVGIAPANSTKLVTTNKESNKLKEKFNITEKGVFIALPNYFIEVTRLGTIYNEGKIAYVVNIEHCYIDKITNTFFRPDLLDKSVFLTTAKKKVPVYFYSTGNEVREYRESTILTNLRDTLIGYPDGLYSEATKRISIVDINGKFGWVDVRDIVLKKRKDVWDVNKLIEEFNKYFVRPIADAHQSASESFQNNIQKPLENALDSAKKGFETVKLAGFSLGLFLLLTKLNK